VETVREPLVVLDKEFRVLSANEAFFKTFQYAEQEIEGKALFSLGGGDWDIPALRDQLAKVLPKRKSFEDFLVECTFTGIGTRRLLLNARRIYERGVAKERILLAMEDVTGNE